MRLGLLVLLWQLTATIYAADTPHLVAGDNACFQTLVIKDVTTQKIRQFSRWGTTVYGIWAEEVPFPHAKTKVWRGRPKEIKQSAVKAAMGDKLFELLTENNQVTQSGHYNLSGDPSYDWEEFAGYTYTTKDAAAQRLPVTLLIQPPSQ